jgi:hypothetical protein
MAQHLPNAAWGKQLTVAQCYALHHGMQADQSCDDRYRYPDSDYLARTVPLYAFLLLESERIKAAQLPFTRYSSPIDFPEYAHELMAADPACQQHPLTAKEKRWDESLLARYEYHHEQKTASLDPGLAQCNRINALLKQVNTP